MALTIGAFIVGVLFAATPALAGLIVSRNPDVSWLLVIAERLLEGARFGRDVIEIHQPLIAWLIVPAVALALAVCGNVSRGEVVGGKPKALGASREGASVWPEGEYASGLYRNRVGFPPVLLSGAE